MIRKHVGNRFRISAALFLIFCLAPLAASAAAESPRAVVTETTYEFEPVYEGKEVMHAFTIKNKGDAVLDIENVRTGWGCTTVSYARQIPPGGEGTIQLKLDTRGYGGKTLRQGATVYTSDPDNRQIRLMLKGKVKKFVTINPRRVYLNGPAGEEISQNVTIIPETEEPFRIMTVQAMKGEHISYELEEKEADGRRAYELTVENELAEPGRYNDRLVLITDAGSQPLSITVIGYIEKDPDAQE